MTTPAPELPDGITPAGHCAISTGHRTGHQPHVWAWDPLDTGRQIYPRERAPLPFGAQPYWCDGGVPAAKPAGPDESTPAGLQESRLGPRRDKPHGPKRHHDTNQKGGQPWTPTCTPSTPTPSPPSSTS